MQRSALTTGSTKSNNANTNNTSRAVKSLDEQFRALLKATLETWAHQVLYRRRVYPSSTFCPTTVWGVRCHACRAKQVVLYIQDSIEAALSSSSNVLQEGLASRLSLVIVQEAPLMEDDNGSSLDNNDNNDDFVEKERLTLAFDHVRPVKNMDELRQAERAMRDLILRTQSIPENNNSKLQITDDTSFRLVWHLEPTGTAAAVATNRNTSAANNEYGEFVQGFNRGTWMEDSSLSPPHQQQEQQPRGLIRRPLYRASSNPVQINFYSQTIQTLPRPKPNVAARRRDNVGDEDDDDDEIILG